MSIREPGQWRTGWAKDTTPSNALFQVDSRCQLLSICSSNVVRTRDLRGRRARHSNNSCRPGSSRPEGRLPKATTTMVHRARRLNAFTRETRDRR